MFEKSKTKDHPGSNDTSEMDSSKQSPQVQGYPLIIYLLE